MSDLIETKSDMLRAGYKFRSTSTCKGCGAAIEWWITSNKKTIPFNPTPADDQLRVTPHWATCPKSDDFRKGKGERKQSTQAPSEADRRHQLRRFQASSNARVVIAIFDDGVEAFWRKGIPGEDLRHELITEANSIRNHIERDDPQ